MSGDSGRDLLPRMRAGDADAAAAFARRYQAALVRFCTGYLGDGHAAEDAAQDVLHKALQAEAVPDDLTVWLYTVARNHCLNVLRARGRRPQTAALHSDLAVAASVTGPATHAGRADELQRVARLLERLPDAEREVLRLRYAEDLSREQIATILDLPVSVVKSRLYEGMKRLRALLEP